MIKLHKTPYEYVTEAYLNGSTPLDLGTPVVLTSGKLAASATPEYITLEPCDANEARCLVHKIVKDELYSMPLSVAGTSLNIGDKVTITTDGKATATTSNGIFEIVEFKGKAEGDIVVGRFN